MLDFEKPIVELQTRIHDLERYAQEKNLDVTEEVQALSRRLQSLKLDTYRDLSAWQRVQLARTPGRPTSLDYLSLAFTGFQELHGDRAFGDDPAIVIGLARLSGRPVAVIGQQKGRDTKENITRNFGMANPEGFRKAIRAMDLADRFGLPLVTLIDTPGGYPGVVAEERGQAWLIAQSIERMARLRVPAVAVIIGEGGSGGALAVGVGNRVLIQENAVYSVISPESCAAILWRDAKEAEKAAAALRLTSRDLLNLGVVETIIPEPDGGAHHDAPAAARLLREAVEAALAELDGKSPEELQDERAARFRRMGVFSEG
ncbi:MAG TPA: acetyl-CoA carboxylase carboxyltransferase subunit alpha [Deinococcales bacterium]|nr:acetyl-CoA carboxylase carboxyltransferase subunit alpha [Deinococcales bacterium]